MKKIIVLLGIVSSIFATPNCVAYYGDTDALNECLKKIPKKGNLEFISTSSFEVQKDPHIVKISKDKYCYREDISLKACVLISTKDALKAIREYKN